MFAIIYELKREWQVNKKLQEISFQNSSIDHPGYKLHIPIHMHGSTLHHKVRTMGGWAIHVRACACVCEYGEPNYADRFQPESGPTHDPSVSPGTIRCYTCGEFGNDRRASLCLLRLVGVPQSARHSRNTVGRPRIHLLGDDCGRRK